MLVLSRKPGEEILIGDNVTLVVQRVSGSRVTVGIAAPEGVRVLRSEIACRTPAKNDKRMPVDSSARRP